VPKASKIGFVNSVVADRAATILVIEDNELNRKLFRDLLGAHGYDALVTVNGRKAFASRASASPT